MMQSMIHCAFAGGWLMGAIALLVLLLLAVAVGALLLSGSPARGMDNIRRSRSQGEGERAQ